jgi:hypothetical protein
VLDNGGGRAPRPSLNAQDPPPSRTTQSLADLANVVDLDDWLLAHGRWTFRETERSRWAAEWRKVRLLLGWPS